MLDLWIRSQDLVAKCENCEHIWWEKVDLPMDLMAFGERLKAMSRCPKCGVRPRRNAKKQVVILSGEARKEAIQYLRNLPIADRVLDKLSEEKED